MSIVHMNAEKFEAFKQDRKAIPECSIPAPVGVTILNMTRDHPGVVVAFDDGKGGAYVVGDTIGVYRGDEAPSYVA